LQLGAEIYGHDGLEADLEILELALDSLRAVHTGELSVDLADVRVVNALLSETTLSLSQIAEVHAALASKDTSALAALTAQAPKPIATALQQLTGMYGDASILEQARAVLPALPAIQVALDQLQWLAGHLEGVNVSFDLADLRGYAYYTGARFAVYASGAPDALVRGGRYDAVGSVFGRKRPAVGFSLDIKALALAARRPALRAAIRAPWGEDTDLRQAIATLRAAGETVVCVLPGHESDVDEFQCDRELVLRDAAWRVTAL
jgi:ATP phosphoribosyltransferase regulatory subunit